jgi:hypothetical protein
MPNWCDNDLYVAGPATEVRACLDLARGGDGDEELLLDFNKFAEWPESITPDLITDPWVKAVAPDDLWRQWRLQYWGTKSQPQDASVEVQRVYGGGGDMAVKLTFLTAWSPPKPIVLAASRRFPALDFDLRYYECGNAFHGRYRCLGGAVESDEEGEYFGDRGG